MGAYISKQVKMHAYHLWDIKQWVVQISLQKIPTESIKWKANLKWPGLKLLLKNFHFWEFFNLGRPPTRIRPSEKSLYFSITLKCAFEPLIIIFRALSSLYLLSKCAFELLTIQGIAFLSLTSLFENTFEPYLPSNAPSSLWSSFLGCLWVFAFLVECLWALAFLFESAFEPSLPSSSTFEHSLSSSSAFEHLLSPRVPLSTRFSLRAHLWALAFPLEYLWALAFSSSVPLSPRFPLRVPLSTCFPLRVPLSTCFSLRVRLWALTFSLRARLWALATLRVPLSTCFLPSSAPLSPRFPSSAFEHSFSSLSGLWALAFSLRERL